MEPDTKNIYLLAGHFKKYLAETGGNYNGIIKELKANGSLIAITKKGMSKGTYINTAPVDVVVINAEKMGVEIPTQRDDQNILGQD
jgi:hypothetical protein